MEYHNPVVRGFYPDPSVCCAEGVYYMVCSSFQYFPGVPLFRSGDLVNWTQIGHVLTRRSQVMLEKIASSGGVFAPTIRYYNGRFYMVTTNDTTHQNFYVYTDDITGAWSDPVAVEQDGIDPSLYFEDGRFYFMSNGTDDCGRNGVVQCEIDIVTGKKLSPSQCIWQGSGGRFLESPHLYHIDGTYYLMAAEGGTEYGHMITCARSSSLWGPFASNPGNPVLTNRNKAPYQIQGIGHGDLIQDNRGDWHILSLGFRQLHQWMPYHTLGREVFLTPVQFQPDGWFTAGRDGTTDETYELAGMFVQQEQQCFTFQNTDWRVDWCFLRHPHMEQYQLLPERAVLHGTDVTLQEADSPTWIGLRQREFFGTVTCRVSINAGEAGIGVYMTEQEHYEVALRQTGKGFEAVLLLTIGNLHCEQGKISLSDSEALLKIEMAPFVYRFSVQKNDQWESLGFGYAKYLSSEVAGGFTGVLIDLYAVGNNRADFSDFRCVYTPNQDKA